VSSSREVSDGSPTSGAETVVITADPIKIKPGSPLSGRALVQRPANIPNVMSWTLETRRHR
jgi:hypothetical protein